MTGSRSYPQSIRLTALPNGFSAISPASRGQQQMKTRSEDYPGLHTELTTDAGFYILIAIRATPFPRPSTPDRPFPRDTSQHSALRLSPFPPLTYANTDWTILLIIPAFSLYVCHMYKRRTALRAFRVHPLLRLTFSPLRLSVSLSILFHRPSVYGPEFCWYLGGEDHANRHYCLLRSVKDHLKASV